MAGQDTYTNIPSGAARANPGQFRQTSAPEIGGQGETGAKISPLMLILVGISILLSISAIYVATSPRQLSATEKSQIAEIAAELRAMQQKEITMSSPLKTTAYIEESFPASDLFPDEFEIDFRGEMPLNQQVSAITTAGQVVTMRLNSTLPVTARLSLDNQTGSPIRVSIKKEIPIDTRLQATFRIQTLFGKEFNSVIDKLEKISD